MEEKKLSVNVSSAILEKGFDAANGFLSKLISPAVEEVGLLLKDQVTHWRFKKQVRLLNKTQELCLKNNINPKTISLKLLIPLLEGATLEEDGYLQDKWAALLSNLVDSDQNIENHVLPFLLSQISRDEYSILESVRKKYNERYSELKVDIMALRIHKGTRLVEIQKEIDKANNDDSKENSWTKYSTIRMLSEEAQRLETHEWQLRSRISEPEYFNNSIMKMYELANLTRLGLIQAKTNHYAFSSPTKDMTDSEAAAYVATEEFETYIRHSGDLYFMTELGEIFIDSCTEKADRCAPLAPTPSTHHSSESGFAGWEDEQDEPTAAS